MTAVAAKSPKPGIAVMLVIAIALLAVVTVGRIPGHGLWATEVMNRIAGALLALAATTAIIVPVAWTRFAYLQRHRVFPTLLDFDST